MPIDHIAMFEGYFLTVFETCLLSLADFGRCIYHTSQPALAACQLELRRPLVYICCEAFAQALELTPKTCCACQCFALAACHEHLYTRVLLPLDLYCIPHFESLDAVGAVGEFVRKKGRTFKFFMS